MPILLQSKAWLVATSLMIETVNFNPLMKKIKFSLFSLVRFHLRLSAMLSLGNTILVD